MNAKSKTAPLMNPEIDEIVNKAKQWKDEISRLRVILLESGLIEEKKWWQPCYTFEGKNIAIIGSFKEYCSLSFFKGALLKDKQKILVSPGENSQSVKLVKLTGLAQINKLESTLKSYIKEAIKNEKDGLKINFKSITEHTLPEELQEKFKQNPAFEKAFKALTPGRQRAYILTISSAKQTQTRFARIEKYMPQIMAGKGLND